MIAQFALTTLLFAVLLYAWRQYRRAPAVGLFAMLAAMTGLYFVWRRLARRSNECSYQ